MRRKIVAVIVLLPAILAASLTAPAIASSNRVVRCDGGQSLAQAITAAAPGDTIYVQGTCQGAFTISKSITIVGKPSATLAMVGCCYTTVTVLSGDVTMRRLTITGGSAQDGGGIYNTATLHLEATTVRGNNADSHGAGVYNTGVLDARDSSISDNALAGGPDGGLFNQGSATLERSLVSSNTGGGILNEGNLTLRRTAVMYNNDYENPGVTNAQGATVRIVDSTVSNNSSTVGTAGGIYNQGRMRLIQSTVSGNDNGNSAPGGIGNGFTGKMVIVGSTISRNFSDDGDGGGIENEGGSVSLAGTILAGNRYSDCTGSFKSRGYNLIGRITHNVFFRCEFRSAPTDLVGQPGAPIKPRLRPLGPYGGPTETMPPKADSPAIDVIPVGAHYAGLLLCPQEGTLDQRGVPRPQGPACDIGSVEVK